MCFDFRDLFVIFLVYMIDADFSDGLTHEADHVIIGVSIGGDQPMNIENSVETIEQL